MANIISSILDEWFGFKLWKIHAVVHSSTVPKHFVTGYDAQNPCLYIVSMIYFVGNFCPFESQNLSPMLLKYVDQIHVPVWAPDPMMLVFVHRHTQQGATRKIFVRIQEQSQLPFLSMMYQANLGKHPHCAVRFSFLYQVSNGLYNLVSLITLATLLPHVKSCRIFYELCLNITTWNL